MDKSLVEIWSLPDEVLYKIFSYLPPRNILATIVDVSYRWRSIVESDLLFWRNLQIVVFCDQFLNLSHLESSLNSSSSLSDGPSYEEESGVVIGEKDLTKVSKVRCLKLEGDSKTTTVPALFVLRVLDIISKKCKDIEIVESIHCFGATSNHFLKFLNERYKKISEISFGITAVWRIPYEEFSNFLNLSTIISHDYKFTRSDIYKIADGCSQLNSLWILFSRSVTNDDILYFLEKRKDNLKEIGLGSSVGDVVLEKVKDCLNLNVLFICDARYITESSLTKITNLQKLNYVSLHRAKVRPEALSDWVFSSTVPTQLRVLDLTYYYFKDSNSLNIISQVCPVTTSNYVNKAVTQPKRRSNSKVHWMYNNVL